jgi:tRNA modification GTPase
MSATTRAAVLTPPGAAAVATIALIGPAAWMICRGAFRGFACQLLPEVPTPSRHWSGNFGAPPGDTVVISVRRCDPAPWVEIHCHGGSHVVRWLLDDLQTRGGTIAPWKDLMAETGESPLRAAASVELTRAVTARTAAILLDQQAGSLDAELAAIKSALDERDLDRAGKQLDALLQFAELGRHLTRPWRVAVAGPPNVGKSSLINRLVGYPRCVVTPAAGTTRDVVATAIAVDGWPVDLIDTAGQRNSADAVEQAGVALAAEAVHAADLTLWLLDASAASPPPSDIPTQFLPVRNKIDLISRWPNRDFCLPISALTGQGLAELLSAMSQRLVPTTPLPGAAIPFSPAVADQLTAVAKLVAASAVSEAAKEIESLINHFDGPSSGGG